jgi:hypothetical protein
VRIYKEAMSSPCGSGAVFVFILDPAGHVIDGLDAARAARGNALAETLQAVVKKLDTHPGPPVVKPTPQSQPPAHDADSVVLHVTTRSFRKVFPWGVLPAENWIVLKPGEWSTLLPSRGKIAVGSAWAIQDGIARTLLGDFYPPMEELDTSDNRAQIEIASLRATVISVQQHSVAVRLDGTLKMKRAFYARRNDDNRVNAAVIGLLEFDVAARRIGALYLVTDRATYGSNNGEDFGAALSLVSDQTVASRGANPQR